MPMIVLLRRLRRTALPCLLLAVLPLAALAQTGTGGSTAPRPLEEGRDYVNIPFGAPLAPQAGGIEVVEVFAYGCIHCDQFQPMLEAWQARQPDDVRLVLLPAAYSANDALRAASSPRRLTRITSAPDRTRAAWPGRVRGRAKSKGTRLMERLLVNGLILKT